MKLKLTLPLAVFLLLLTVALCTGSQLFLLLSALVLLVMAGAVIAVLWAAATLEADGELTAETVHRGDDVTLYLRMRHRGWIPIAPLLLELSDPAGNRDRRWKTCWAWSGSAFRWNILFLNCWFFPGPSRWIR